MSSGGFFLVSEGHRRPSEAFDEEGEFRSQRHARDGGLAGCRRHAAGGAGDGAGAAEGQRRRSACRSRQRRTRSRRRSGTRRWARSRKRTRLPGKTAFDQYKINEMLWYVYLQQGRNADAARVLEGQLASGQMPAGEKLSRTKTLAQLYARAGNYGKSAAIAKDYLKSVPDDKDMQLLVANAYYQQKNYKARDRRGGAGHEGRRHAEPGPAAALAALELRARRRRRHGQGTRPAAQVLPDDRHVGARARRLPEDDQARPRADGAVSPRRGRGRAQGRPTSTPT